MNSRDLFRYDPDLGYTFIPNLKVRVAHETGGYLVRTNSYGFRSNHEPDSSGQKIFVFGDSFTAGDGVSNGKRWSDELERLMPGFEVHNFGLPGSGTDQQMLALEKFGTDFQCDLVVVVVLVENIRRITSAFRPFEMPDGEVRFKAKPYFELVDGELVRHHDPVPMDPISSSELGEASTDSGGRYPGLRKLVSKLGVKELVQRMTAYQPVPDYDDPSSNGWKLMSAILKRYQKICPGEMIIVPLPLYQHIEETADASSYQARFAEIGEELGVTIVDPLAELRNYSIEDRRRFRFENDVHLTPEGHAAVARALASSFGGIVGANQ
ncbi:MAG: SGNH/GDSL hydrolase family protein [Rhizobiaceae bacterium]|nr:SGNH/GDSL hydrolase family protein [Rhizobiaceae bacterium]